MRFISLTIFCLSNLIVFSQPKADTLKMNDNDSIKPKEHSVKKAMIFSAVVPGAGQIYNHIAMPKGQKKAFWKVPLIYAGLGTTGYFLITNQQKVKSLKTEYTNRLEGNPTDPQWEIYDDQGVLSLFTQYQNNRDLSILGIALVYLFQVADAGIEAHFVRFDVSRDLSLMVRPKFQTTTFSYVPYSGLSFQFDFKQRDTKVVAYKNQVFL
ncbi:MAG: DUF5683 domain-containing protein [Bacteroidota bacterium]